MSEHQKTITSIAWHPSKDELLASSSVDGHVVVWNVTEQRKISELRSACPANCQPRSVAWCPKNPGFLSFLNGRGPLMTWRYIEGDSKNAVAVVKETQSVSSGDVSRFRWHPGIAGRVVFGHSDGTVSLTCPGQKPQRHFPLNEEAEANDPVLGLEWDPLSASGGGDSSCLLAASPGAGLCMLSGGDRLSVLMRFSLPSAAAELQTLAWLPSAPGLFVTGDANVGLLRLFNVSRPTALETFRLKEAGFRTIQVFTDPLPSRNSNVKGPDTDGDSPEVRADTQGSGSVVVPPAHVVCTFLDGGVGVYNLQQTRWAFLREKGHIETIFDCQFQPQNANHLATGSFDGSIKVWDVRNMSAIVSSPGNESIIYSLAWCPHRGQHAQLLAAGTSKNGVLIFDAQKSVFAKRFQEHKGSIFSVSWSPIAEDQIASGSSDCTCLVRNLNGKILATLSHPRGVFGVEWSPFHKYMLATGCEDAIVRIFDTNSGQAVQLLKGHTGKVFHVRFSPMKEDLLCSSSDDKTVRVWDTVSGSSRCVLQGHAAPVRGLAWHWELPYLLASGSWDASVRMWDVRDSACVETVLDHGADVYGLAWHPRRPFLLATSSRDTTLRLWSLDPMAQATALAPLVRELRDNFVGCSPVDRGLTVGASPRLYGNFSGHLRRSIEKEANRDFELLQLLVASPHLENLWNLVECLKGVDEGFLRESYPKGIVHKQHMLKYRRAKALELELAQNNRLSGVQTLNREERTLQAAQLHLLAGDLRRHCDLLIRVGRWERALALAPGVSLAYWSQLSRRFTSMLAARGAQDALAPMLATGRVQEAVQHLQQRGQQEEAFYIAQAGAEGCFATPKDAPSGGYLGSSEASALVETVALESAEQLLVNGSPVLAACQRLAIGDVEGGVSKLIRGNELVLASWLAQNFQCATLVDFALSCLLRRCDKMAARQFAVSLSRACRQNAQDFALLCLCARRDGTASEIDALHHTAGVPLMEQCLEKARQVEQRIDGDGAAVEECVKWYLLSSKPELALKPGLTEVKRRMSSPDWRASQVVRLLWSLANLRPSRLQRSANAQCCAELCALCAILGAALACARGFLVVVPPLLQSALTAVQRHALESQLPFALDDIKEDLEAFTKFSDDGVRLVGADEARWRRWVARGDCGGLVFPADLESGEIVVGGSNLPAHSDVNTSHFSGQRVRGPVFLLDDGRTTISLNEALMWASVNPLSPTGTGALINPF